MATGIERWRIMERRDINVIYHRTNPLQVVKPAIRHLSAATPATWGPRNGGIEPLLRWAGGKQRLAPVLVDTLPNDFHNRTYVEPFVGAGSLFFRLAPTDAFISDANSHLVSCYRQIRDQPLLVSRHLRALASKDGPRTYYRTRNRYNAATASAAQAARFIYLNRTCFNGIFRVNQAGAFNVPYGWKSHPIIPDRARLLAASKILQTARLRTSCFRKALLHARQNSFVYLDPPYPPLNGTAYFTHYTEARFSDLDQKDLADLVSHLDAKGTRFMMTNANTALIRDLYRKFSCRRLPVVRFVSCRSVKYRTSELIITNY